MKAWIQTTPDFEYEVIDVYLGIKSMETLIRLEGFNDDEWEEATRFAEEVATALGIEYIGEVGEANHENHGMFTRDFRHMNGKKFRMCWRVYYGTPETVKTVFEPAVEI